MAWSEKMAALFWEKAIVPQRMKTQCRRICRFATAKLKNTVALLIESAVRKEATMEKIRALSKAQFAQSGFDTNNYHFITEPGTFTAYLDLKVWGKRCLECFFTFVDGRKIIACTFPEADYLGLADIPIGTECVLTFEETVRSKHIYLRNAEAVL